MQARAGDREALRLVLSRVARTLAETGERFPLFCEARGPSDAAWETTADGNWCAGYWIGLLWLAARHAPTPDRQRFLDAAYGHLPALLAQPGGHLFAGLNHHYAGFLGYDVTGDPELLRLGLRGADMMLELYDATARQIPIGVYATAPQHDVRTARTPGDRTNIAAVDAIHTSLPILLRAYAETGRPAYLDVALAHLGRHLDWHIRDDGSTTQMTTFDPATGEPIETFSTLAATDDGCWSRGLGWNIAGLATLVARTGDGSALAALERSVGYYAARTAEGRRLPAWDLALEGPGVERDASAAAVIAYGLLGLGDRAGHAPLAALGRTVLDALLAGCLLRDPDAANAGAVLHGCYRRPKAIAVDAELIWSDFYVAAALDRMLGPARGFSGD
jgi:unsaturated chondroitin disaccharide hydrolase